MSFYIYIYIPKKKKDIHTPVFSSSKALHVFVGIHVKECAEKRIME